MTRVLSSSPFSGCWQEAEEVRVHLNFKAPYQQPPAFVPPPPPEKPPPVVREQLVEEPDFEPDFLPVLDDLVIPDFVPPTVAPQPVYAEPELEKLPAFQDPNVPRPVG